MKQSPFYLALLLIAIVVIVLLRIQMANNDAINKRCAIYLDMVQRQTQLERSINGALDIAERLRTRAAQ